jgi:hypothetical protein
MNYMLSIIPMTLIEFKADLLFSYILNVTVLQIKMSLLIVIHNYGYLLLPEKQLMNTSSQ